MANALKAARSDPACGQKDRTRCKHRKKLIGAMPAQTSAVLKLRVRTNGISINDEWQAKSKSWGLGSIQSVVWRVA